MYVLVHASLSKSDEIYSKRKFPVKFANYDMKVSKKVDHDHPNRIAPTHADETVTLGEDGGIHFFWVLFVVFQSFFYGNV